MRITFLGGADEIGASCAVLDLDSIDGEFRILVDCGQRLSVPPGQELPDFSLLEEGPPIRAILLTHAHTDHIGALPALEPFLADDCAIHGTEATLELTRVMLNDTVRIMVRHRQGDGQLPLFPPAVLPSTLARFSSVRWGKTVRLAGDVRATWFPAGHLLGAAMIEVRGRNESALFSGDLSIADQSTVAGAFVPAITPSLLILESTYGNKLHAHRPTQERKIIERVRNCVAGGGHVLFPTFALGRAQEVLSLLGQAMRRKELDPFPVYADGLVREISRVYSRFPDELSAGCRELCEQGLDPIFPEDLPIRPITSNERREAVARGGPCVVVASSGMLQGGASQFYATHWVREPQSLILITGYQDEESPGDALLNLAKLPEGKQRYFRLGGVQTVVECQVEKFSLSAHADHVELAAVCDKLQPKLTLLVHGETDAREKLANTLARAGRADVVLPENGVTYSLASAPRARGGFRSPQRLNPLSLWPPWDPLVPRALDLAQIHAWLLTLTPRVSWITLDELAEIWKSPEPVSASDLDDLRTAIAVQAQPYFVPEPRRPYLLHLTSAENLSRSDRIPSRVSIEEAAQMAHEVFHLEKGTCRLGFYPDEGALSLEVPFPKAARQLREQASEFLRRTGWHVRLNERTEETHLTRFAGELLTGIDPLAIEIAHDERQVRVASPLGEVDFDHVASRFLQHTGYELVVPSQGGSRAESPDVDEEPV